MNILRVENLSKNFGGLHALNQVTFNVSAAEIVSVIGPNGAGKTTLFNLLTAINPPTTGTIFFNSKNICAMPRHQLVQLGITRTFQNIRLFSEMSALENVMVGLHCRTSGELLSAILRSKKVVEQERKIKDQAMQTLAFVNLHSFAHQPAKNLPYGAQRKLEIARALCSQPKLLLLDEPAAGMNPTESLALLEIIQKIRDQGTSIILIEHQMRLVMNVSDRIIVLDHGSKIAEGKPQEIATNKKVIQAYLGNSNH